MQWWKKVVTCGRLTKSTWQNFIISPTRIPDMNNIFTLALSKSWINWSPDFFSTWITPGQPYKFQGFQALVVGKHSVFFKEILPFLSSSNMENLQKIFPFWIFFCILDLPPHPASQSPAGWHETCLGDRRPGIPSPKPLNLPLLLLGAGEMIQSILIYIYIYLRWYIYI